MKQTVIVKTKIRVIADGEKCHPQCQYLVEFQNTNNCGLFWVRLADGAKNNIRRCIQCKKAELK